MRFQTFHYKITTNAKRTITSMTDSPYSSGLDPAAAGAPSAPPAPPVAPEAPASVPGTGTQLIAPVWHTIVLLIIILGNSYFASVRLAHNVQNRGRILLYLGTMVWQLLLFGLVWFGFRLKKTKLRDVIGGAWRKTKEFLFGGANSARVWN